MTVQSELEKKELLLRLSSNILNALLDGLSLTDQETRQEIMMMCGEACAREEHWGSATQIAERIAEEEDDIERILARANDEILWCGKWVMRDDRIESTCGECGCSLVRFGVVKNTGVFCDCSKGWVQTIFSTLLKQPVRVDLEKAIGFGDDECRYIVRLGGREE
jgi:hypothetical protein